MTKDSYLAVKEKIINAGYAHEIEWAENLKPCPDAGTFFCEYMWVVLNSGMKNQIAAQIEARIYKAWEEGKPTTSAFGHRGKCDAIDLVRMYKNRVFGLYQGADDKIAFLKTLPWIGDITKFHLAKNLGHDYCKPDRHLMRIAKVSGMAPDELCKSLSASTGDKIATIDSVLWRAGNLGFI
jgi:DNA-binding phage protein